MTPLHHLACFGSGLFFANAVPHFTHGISGDRFPTPFAKPPGKGLSSAPLNMVWALFNLALGYAVFPSDGLAGLPTLFAGAAIIGLLMSFRFSRKHAA